MDKNRKKVIGRNVLIHFANLRDGDVPAKVDTGAFRSALHATNISVDYKEDGKKVLSCDLFGHQHAEKSVHYETEDYEEVETTNSFGHTAERFAIELPISVEGEAFVASFSLADRSNNTYPILFGRRAMNGRFVVDPEQFAVLRKDLHLISDEFNTDSEEEDE